MLHPPMFLMNGLPDLFDAVGTNWIKDKSMV
jgi:hypothetical protein